MRYDKYIRAVKVFASFLNRFGGSPIRERDFNLDKSDALLFRFFFGEIIDENKFTARVQYENTGEQNTDTLYPREAMDSAIFF